MPRYKLIIEYDGTNYCGWQKQIGLRSIQEEIEKAIYKFSNEETNLYGSGRTDSGVHALNQVAHVDLAKDWLEETVTKAINSFLKSQAISIISTHKVSDDFHARFSAKKRYYEYLIINRRAPLTLNKNRAWHVINPLNIEKMREASKTLEGTHDFSSFRSSMCEAKSPVKTLDYIKITGNGEQILFELCAKSFLHSMVRNLVGALYLVGSSKWSLQDLQNFLGAKDATQKFTAPARGLYLLKVEY